MKQVRVQRCGKSAPAVSRGTGSVNPGGEQGRRDYGWSFPNPDFRRTARGVWQQTSQIDNRPQIKVTLMREQNPAYVLTLSLILFKVKCLQIREEKNN